MAKVSNTATTSTTRRSFAVSAESIATVRPFLEAGQYSGKVTNASIDSPFGEKEKSIKIVPITKWEPNTPHPTSGKMGYQRPTGEFTIEGSIYFTATLTSKKAIQRLQRDEPVIFGGQISLGFTADGMQDAENNIPLINTAAALGIDLDEIKDSVEGSFEWDDNVEIPEYLQGVANAVDLLNAVQFHTEYYAEVAARMNNVPALFVVTTSVSSRDSSQKVNNLGCGVNKSGFSTGRVCCVAPYVEGAELDLPDSE